MKIYTRTGDHGETSLFTGERVSKNDPFIHALGTVDECNSALGLALAHLPKEDSFSAVQYQIEMVQHALFDLGASLATPLSRSTLKKTEKTRFDDEATRKLELWMDEMGSLLPPLKNFILPGGHPASAALHLARSICRRAERNTVFLDQSEINQSVVVYLNRLSDYLFMLARYVNSLTMSPETLWDSHKSLTH